MALLPSGSNPYGSAISLKMPGLPAGINYDFFFDRAKIKGTLSEMKHKALYKAGSVVMQIARRSIKRMGMAHPTLVKARKANPDVSVREIIARSDAGGNKRLANSLRLRMQEIRRKDASSPGTPPHTHKGNLRDKPGIVYAWDGMSDSVVVGQHEPSAAWLASLHEFGGREQMRGWVFLPKYPRTYTGIIGWWRVGVEPWKKDRWAPTGMYESHQYPERPYMRPAFRKAIDSGRIAAEFKNKFRVGGT